MLTLQNEYSEMEKSTKDSFLLKTLQFNNRRYSIGLFNKEGLFIKEEWIRSTINTEYGIRIIEFNMKRKEVKVSDDAEGTIISKDSDSECYSIIDLNEDGIHWEGIVVNDSPLGYGSLYNSSNELVYQGVMIHGKKECFGIELFPDLSQIEYIGCYWNNERHGFGMLYDRKGELVYEGDWWFGSNDFERNQKVVLKDIDNDRMFHSLIHELIIDEGVGNDYKGDLFLCEFNYLERLVVKSNSFQNVNCLKISDNCVLKSIEIEDGKMRGYSHPSGSFNYVRSVMITSTSNDED